MNIGEAIKQKKFEDAVEKAMINIIFTANWLQDCHKKIFSNHGIQPQHYNVLRILMGRYPDSCSGKDIKKVMLDKSPDMTRLIDKLEKFKWVSRKICPESRRQINISITSEGIQKLQGINIEVKENTDKLRKKISQQDASRLSDLLDRFRF